jgi:O-antigen/teichoic acid export membrane protein
LNVFQAEQLLSTMGEFAAVNEIADPERSSVQDGSRMINNVNQFQQALREYLSGLFGWRPGPLAKGTMAMTVAMGLRSLAQTLVFLIVARVLGVADYGAYAAVLALSTAFACFTGWGTQVLMVRDVCRDLDHFADAWGRTLTAILISSPILFVVYMVLARALLPASVSLAVILFVGLADLIFAPIGLSAITAYQGHDRLDRAARLSFIPVLPRLAVALALFPLQLVLSKDMRLSTWAFLYAVAAFAAALYAWRMVRKELGPARKPSWRYVWSSLPEAIAFAFGSAALKVYGDIDKMMLARLVTLEAAGAYSAGYRVADLTSVPLLSLLSAAMPRFFRAGEGGVSAALAYAHRILLVPLVYSILAGLGLYLCAGVLPLLLGATYSDAVPALQWLAWFPLISLPRLLLQSLLIGGDRQNYAVEVLAGGALFNIALNLWVIPLWSWRGALAATYAAEIAMAVAMGVIAFSSQAKQSSPVSGKEIRHARL